MNNSDFKEAAEKYRQEMMKLYNPKPLQQSETPAPPLYQPEDETMVSDMPPVSESPSEPPPQEPVPQETENDIPQDEETDIFERFPPPVIPDFIISGSSDNPSYGYLKVNVRTGNGGLPVEQALVTVSEIRDGKEHILKLFTTDSSGSTETIRLPAPLQTTGDSPDDYNKYSVYNISAYSKGFFREKSLAVPIFSDITSIQNFYLIPEPFDYNSGEQTIVNRNTEPLI